MLVLPIYPISARIDRFVQTRIMRLWGKTSLRLIGCQLGVRGTPPSPPYFFVSNHVSYVDGLVLSGLLGETFVGMAEIRDWPLIGFIAEKMGTVFINRRKLKDAIRVGDIVEQAIERGEGVIVFVESKISSGDDVLPFRPALLEPAVSLKMPVHYASIRYHTSPDDPPPSVIVAWTDDTPFAIHAFRLLMVRRFRVTVAFGAAPLFAADRKELAQLLEDAVRKQLHEMV